MKTKRLLFLALLVGTGIVLMQIPFTALVGANARFTLFDFYAPIIGGFLGSTIGVAAVFVMQIANWAWHGFHTDAATLIRLLPTLASTLYFARKSLWQIVLPVVAMVTFWAHPQGLAAWPYALYWLIPIAMYFVRERFVFARALGATFTAHAVGGALWVWALNMPAALWTGLIPVVWKERGLMALGIALSYVALQKLFAWITARGYLPLKVLTATNK